MICKNCGATLADTASFCPSCGMVCTNNTNTANTTNTADMGSPVKNAPSEQASACSKSVLIFGILGLAFSVSFYLSILGIFFSSIALKKANSFKESEGSLYGRAKVGKNLGLGGLIAGIVLTIVLIITICLCGYFIDLISRTTPL